MLISEQLHEFLNLKPEELRTELKSMIERIRALEEMSRTDELTGLLNRRGFLEEVKRFEALFERERSRAQVETPNALLAIDLDGFKEVNDTVGHAAGDRCLQIIAQEVKAALRESDIFARIGGDEFGIFLSQINEQDAIAVARKVRGVIEGVVSETLRNEFPAYAGTLSASIGVLPLTSHDGMKIEDQQRYADYAAYVVKGGWQERRSHLRRGRASWTPTARSKKTSSRAKRCRGSCSF